MINFFTKRKILTEKEKKAKHKKFGKLLIIFAAAGVAAFYFFPKKKAAQDIPPIIVKKEIAKNQIQISGYIQAAQEQKLQAPGEGIIETVQVKEGSRVKKGDLLFALDSTFQAVQLSKQEFAIKQERINGASEKLKLMEKERSLLVKQLRDRSVYAKFDGVIAALDLTQGQYAKAQDYFGSLIDRSYLKATVEVSEADASRLAVGAKVLLNFAAVPGTEVEGKIIAYPSMARLNSLRGNTVLDAKIIVENPPEGVLPGYSFSGIIIAGEDEEILLAEKSAIRYEKGVPYIDKIMEDGKTESTPVEIAPYISGFIKIISGVAEGDKLKNQSAGKMQRNSW